MKQLARVLKLVLVLGCTIVATNVMAYDLLSSWSPFCQDGVHWPEDSCKSTPCGMTSRGFRTVCLYPNTTLENNETGWAFWMWQREFTHRSNLFWDQSACTNDSDWIDADSTQGNGRNEFNWQPSVDGGGPGYTHFDSTDFCDPFASHRGNHFVATDITLKNNADWRIQSPSHMICLAQGLYRERVAMHEIGHAYGVGHNNALPSIMRSVAGFTGGCNRGAQWRTQPDADAKLGSVHWGGRNTDNVDNISASPWVMNGGAVPELPHVNELNYCGSTHFIVPLTLFNYYRTVGTVQFWVGLVPNGYEPNQSLYNVDGWQGPYQLFNVSKNFNGQVNLAVQPSPTDLAHGVTYRVWLFLDLEGQLSETDEADNWIPLDALVKRGTGC